MSQLLHPLLRQHAPALLSLIDMAKETNPEPEELERLIEANPAWATSYQWVISTLMENRLQAMGGNVYAVPFLDPSVCKRLIEQSDKIAEDGGWRRNPAEDSPYQIPEIVLEKRDKTLFNVLAGLIKYLDIYHSILYQNRPTSISSIQFTKYSPDGVSAGNWHHDLDSDFSAVVSLDPEMFEGGGTDVKLAPTLYHHIPPLPQGYALLFNGKMIHHRGCEVTKGSRYLLTYWLDSKGKSNGTNHKEPEEREETVSEEKACI